MNRVWGWVCAGAFVVVGVIYALMNQVATLKQKITRSESEKELGNTIEKMEEAKENADDLQTKSDDSYADFKRAMDEFQSSSGKLPD